MCSKELDGVARLLRKVAEITPYMLVPQANESSSTRDNCRTVPLQDQDSSDTQYQNVLKLKTKIKTDNIKTCWKTKQQPKNKLGAGTEYYIANPDVYWQLLQTIFFFLFSFPPPFFLETQRSEEFLHLAGFVYLLPQRHLKLLTASWWENKNNITG